MLTLIITALAVLISHLIMLDLRADARRRRSLIHYGRIVLIVTRFLAPRIELLQYVTVLATSPKIRTEA